MGEPLRITLSFRVSAMLVPDPTHVVDTHLRPIAAAMRDRIAARSRWAGVREGYALDVERTPTSLTYTIYNTNPAWIWEEGGIKAHTIPQPRHSIPAEQLLDWMELKGISYYWYDYIQSKLAMFPYETHHPGTQGTHAVQDEYEASIPLLDRARDAAISEIIGEW